ncbi:MAG: DUF1851 domain-containing protein [Alphaproteobacteria bacterium]|nr:DUF1851 domain-containing protein [Alphaproteobacteria bacterium]
MSGGLADYTLALHGVDWQAAFAPWAEILPERTDLMLVSRFGDAFLIAPDAAILMLDVNFGRVLRLAEDREHFADLIDAHGVDWLMIPLVDECLAAGRRLLPGQCYAFTRPPLFGGAYRAENVHVAEIGAQLAFLGDLFAQTQARAAADRPARRLFIDEEQGER